MKLSENAVELARRHNKVVFRDGDRVVKVFNDAKPSADIFNEALNGARVEAVGLPVPSVLEVSRIEGGEFDGSWALANRYIPGRTLYEAWCDDPDNINTYLERLVDMQIKVQSVKAPLLNRQKDKLNRMISQTKGIIDATTRYDLHMRLDGMRVEDCVCHGDFIASNIIVGDDGNLSVCDWAHVTAGIPEVDAAMTYMLFHIEHKDLAEPYLDLFCKKADVAKQLVFYWLPVVAAAELSRGRKKQEEFLKSWIYVYDYE